MLGNILFAISVFFLFGFLNVTSSPMPGGDRGVGYALMMIICGGGFFVSTGLLAWKLGANHCFDWLGERSRVLLLLGWFAFAISTMGSALFKTEWHAGEFPQYLQWLSQAQAAIWLPLLVLLPAFGLLNFGKAAPEVPYFIQIPIKIGFSISVLMLLGLVFGYFQATSKQAAYQLTEQKNRTDNQHNEHINYISEQKPDDPILNILALTGRFHDADVRELAVAKVKSHADWEAELIRLLNDTEWQSEVYQFIDGNQVDHPELFVEPIKKSIRRCAKKIRDDIKDSNNLQDWHFEHLSIERLFRAIDEQFSLPGADYRPTVMELRTALDTPKPERFKKVRFALTSVVDDWLKKHGG
jgi:hypothetical protein